MLYFCCDTERREIVLSSDRNGIDYLEVLDQDAPTEDGKKLRQQILLVYLLKPLGSTTLTTAQIRIEGGDRIRDLKVAQVVTFSDSKVVRVRVDQWGDFSTYTLRFVIDEINGDPPVWIDPVLSFITFSFKVECPSEFDCEASQTCPPEPLEQPDINYLAKDYASFRQLMLDRMALLMPQWRERNPADLGIVLVELLAYVGDYLSYQQDAIATEAYLGTARRRPSIRRHARLVDYFMHDGCNARVWVQIQVSVVSLNLPKQDSATGTRTRFLTQCPEPTLIASDRLPRVLDLHRPLVFEPLHDITLYQDLNTLYFYTWSSERCCLPKGSTRATLKGNHPDLKPGAVLVFQEVSGPETGEPADADPTHRHAVRLTVVIPRTDPLVLDPDTGQPLELTEIGWEDEDALPFALCISSQRIDPDGNRIPVADVSVALGNIVLADQGFTRDSEVVRDGDRDRVPAISLYKVPQTTTGDRCQTVEPIPVMPRFRPQLGTAPLTFSRPYNTAQSATATMQASIQTARGAISLRSTLNGQPLDWHLFPDLLEVPSSEPAFVVETEADGTAFLRFGDGSHGQRPESGSQFTATYRTGNGTTGNIGAEAIAHLVSGNLTVKASDVLKIWNPLPARGGTQPETIEEVRQRAPSAFRTQDRAVTPEDYAAMSERLPGIQRAVATFRWTGSWYTVFVSVDRVGGLPVDTKFKTKLRQHLERYRMAGHDLEIEAPIYVPLELEMQICVKSGYFRSVVKQSLLQVFSDRVLPDGRRGLFHPDKFTFGQPVYLSPLYAAAQAVDGVASVRISVFQRRNRPDPLPLKTGRLDLERLEIAQLNNDPNFPDRGIFRLVMEGGR